MISGSSGLLARLLLSSALLACASLAASAQAATVTFVEGEASQGSASGWKPIALGDPIAASATIRLKAGAFVELKAASATLALMRPGDYAVRELLAAGRASRTTRAQAIVRKYAEALSASPAERSSAVAGVRGAEKGEGAGDWISSEADLYLSSARDFLSSGDTKSARRELAKAEAESAKAQAEIEFYLAQVDYLDGDLRSASRRVDALRPDGFEPWAPDYVLLKARLLIDGFAPKDAAALLAGQSGLAGDAARAGLYWFLLALAYKDSGDEPQARDCVARLRSAAPGGELLKTAEDIIGK
jgi:hypothetical protein